jgi:hypothetical protein
LPVIVGLGIHLVTQAYERAASHGTRTSDGNPGHQPAGGDGDDAAAARSAEGASPASSTPGPGKSWLRPA